MKGWIKISDKRPPDDGAEVMFCRAPPFSSTGNIRIGYWHENQNTPGWEAQSGGGTILEADYPYWQFLPQLPSK